MQIFEEQLIDKKNQLSYCDSIMYQSFVTAPPPPFPRTRGTAETLIFRPAANPTYNRHMQGQLTDETTDVYTAVCCFTLH